MRGRVAIPFLLFLLLAQRALPQCPYSRIASVPFRSTAYDVAIDGNDLWLASGYGAALYDRSVDPPRLTALTAVPQTTKLIRAANGTAYTGSGDALAAVTPCRVHLKIAAVVFSAHNASIEIRRQRALHREVAQVSASILPA